MTRILLLIKNELLSLGITSCIRENVGNMQFSRETNWENMQVTLANSDFDLLIIDTNLSNYTNLVALERIRRKQPDIKIIVIGEESEKAWSLPYLRKGVDGVCMKSISQEEFLLAYGSIMRGKKYMDDVLTEYLLSDITKPNLVGSLTVRESEIMQFLIKGRRTVDIAKELKLAVSTISTIKNNIYKKMKVNNVVDLVGKVELSRPRV
ncbi:DNA-binding response regulator, NarL/FixJ family, contains REC and HTH domains [Dyadobacter koreensis]|uniref:DNA-binding response regulator, NarL/FixJ family, contains REC and HTH domains n=1 Tax=Dyadobacter koreensis TaxID=408657 RepID=A0A1H7ANA0_9BACT|nr:response regulator transcription factor [Dyadobacter koreensis]SEJ67131.1 DNA-binding response regulator, NarL/FixJ family, contains REC and HTH domains [Dyadobacter koreensis]